MSSFWRSDVQAGFGSHMADTQVLAGRALSRKQWEEASSKFTLVVSRIQLLVDLWPLFPCWLSQELPLASRNFFLVLTLVLPCRRASILNPSTWDPSDFFCHIFLASSQRSYLLLKAYLFKVRKPR